MSDVSNAKQGQGDDMTAGNDLGLHLQVVSFAAGDGECLLLRCHAGAKCFNILVDGGRASAIGPLTHYLGLLPLSERAIDLFVVTHIDSDHIEGALRIFRDAALGSLVREVWFNDARCAARVDGIALSTDQGDELSDLLIEIGLNPNRHFNGEAVMLRGGEGDTISLGEHTTLRVIGPNRAALKQLATAWPIDHCDSEDGADSEGAIAMGDETPDVEALAASAYHADTSVTNRSSIAMVLRHGSTNVFLASDAWAEDLVQVIEKDARLRSTSFALATLPHHGSKSNLSPALARLVNAERWLASTDGSRGHHHPHAQAIARVLRCRSERGKVQILFNSRHAETLRWNDEELMSDHAYGVQFPIDLEPWVAIDLSSDDAPFHAQRST